MPFLSLSENSKMMTNNPRGLLKAKKGCFRLPGTQPGKAYPVRMKLSGPEAKGTANTPVLKIRQEVL